MDAVVPSSRTALACQCGNKDGFDLSTADSIDLTVSRECPRCRRESAARTDEGEMTVIGRVTIPDHEGDMDDPLVGQSLKHFLITAPLGEGGMGRVYRAIDNSLQRQVAIKVIHPAKGWDHDGTDRISRLLREARAQARMSHPNIAQVYYIDYRGEVPFLAMEFVEGESLAARLKRAPLTFSEIISIALQTAEALRGAAQFGIVHGDIKPGNLLLTNDQTVKLLDFGLARVIQEPCPGGRRISGTPNYLSPEGCQGRRIDHRADMYSLGVMLYEMTFGRLPFEGSHGSLHQRLHAHMFHSVEFPAHWPENVPVSWKEFLNRLLEKNPEDRFVDFDDLLAKLVEFRPAAWPAAPRLARHLANGMDLVAVVALASLAQTIGASAASSGLNLLSPLAVMGLLVAIVFTCWTQVRQGRSPAKRIMGLHIIDTHGLALSKRALLIRSLVQLSPLVALLGAEACRQQGMVTAAVGLLGATLVGILFGAGLCVFREDGRNLLDLWRGTQIVSEKTEKTGRRRA